MRKSGLFLIIVGLGALFLALVFNKPFLKKHQETNIPTPVASADFTEAEELLETGHPTEALAIIHTHDQDLEYSTEAGKKWVDLFIDTSTATRNGPQLVILYEAFPQAFKNKEKASLGLANQYIQSKRTKDYDSLRKTWKGREERTQDWLVLDADQLLLNDQRFDAIELLKSKSFSGPQDTPRLTRLALLNTLNDPKASWDYLTEAYTKDPQNPDIRTYRARLLESLGKKSLALSEYLAAAQTAPNNIFLKDQLADFYLRNGQHTEALEIWLDSLKKPTLDSIWTKSIFWNHVITPIKFDWTSAAQPQGKLKPYIEYLLNLPSNQFWDETTFDKISNSQRFLTSQQSAFWLRLLQNLKDGNEKDALELLQFNPFSKDSWNANLEIALKRVLLYRRAGTLNLNTLQNPLDTTPGITKTASGDNKDENAFFKQLADLGTPAEKDQPNKPIPSDLNELLLSKEAFAVVFLSTGWYEAALQLHSLPVLPSQFPDWVAVALTRAYKINRGNEEALTFATKQRPSQNLALLIGELLAATKNTDSALVQLKKLANEQSEIGMRATWLISLIYIERGQYEQAKQVINAQPRLAQDTLGKETLARIAVLEGNGTLAIQLYSEIEDTSSEAKSYLARKAYAEKDWKKARELTEALVRQFPDNALLRENLKKIIEEQQGQQAETSTK